MNIEEEKMLKKILMEIKNIKVIVQDIGVLVKEDSDAIDYLVKEESARQINQCQQDSHSIDYLVKEDKTDNVIMI